MGIGSGDREGEGVLYTSLHYMASLGKRKGMQTTGWLLGMFCRDRERNGNRTQRA